MEAWQENLAERQQLLRLAGKLLLFIFLEFYTYARLYESDTS